MLDLAGARARGRRAASRAAEASRPRAWGLGTGRGETAGL